MIISTVEKSKKSRDKLLVYIDGSYAFSISEDDYISLNLYEEKELSVEDIDYIKNCINFRSAKSSAIKYLSLKLRSRKEVITKLQSEGFDDDTADSVIEELESLGYINDHIYACKFINDRSKLKPKSKKMLKLELASKGIENEIIDKQLNDLDIDEAELAEKLVKKKFRTYDLSDEKVVKKAYAFLYNRGFSFELIEAAVNKLRNEKL